MKIELRQYQNEAVKNVEDSLIRFKNSMLQMPTGSGKTIVFTEIVKRFQAEHVKKVLVLVHRTELLQQAKKALGVRCFAIEKGVRNIPHTFDFYVGMVETVNRRLGKLPEFGLVVIDEAHIGNFKKMPFFENENTNVLGVTATPIASKPLRDQYINLVLGQSIKGLIDDGYLLNCDVYAFASDQVGAQKFRVRKGEYDEKQMQEFYSSEKMVLNVVQAYWQICRGEKTMVFNVNVAHNQLVYDSLKKEGLNVYQITGQTSKKDRAEILRKFAIQDDAIVCNVGVLTTGFDEPTVKHIILNRATKSLALYLQMVGRGARISPGKERFTVCDLGKNTERFGFYEEQRDWLTYFNKGTKGKPGDGVAPVKECPECGFISHARVLECENCGHNFEEEAARRRAEEKVQMLVKLEREKPVNVPTYYLFDLAKSRGWKPYAVLHRMAIHLAKYQQKHKDLIDDDYIAGHGLTELEKWCKHYNIKFNKWHRDLMIKLIDEKRSAITTENNNVVQK